MCESNCFSWRLLLFAAVSSPRNSSSFRSKPPFRFPTVNIASGNPQLQSRQAHSNSQLSFILPTRPFKNQNFFFNAKNHHPSTMMTRRWRFAASTDDNTIDENKESTERNEGYKDKEIKKKTMEWIQNVVIGLRLCPFADKPVNQSPPDENRFQAFVVHGDDEDEIASKILSEMLRLLVTPKSTSVIITPEFHPTDFYSFLEFISAFEDLYLNNEKNVESQLINRQIQIAPFHPQFQFEGSTLEDVTNYTNRSPYPMFHILREVDVSYASEKLGGDANKVWGRNVDLLTNMEEVLGKKNVERFMEGEDVDGVLEFVMDFDGIKDRTHRE